MASHFGQRGPARDSSREPRRGQASRRAPSSRTAAGAPRFVANQSHGGDESYHAPASNPHAASVPRMSPNAGYVPVTGAVSQHAGSHGRFVETDPYDLSGRRSKSPRKRAGRVVSTLLFIVGLALIGTALGIWLHDQWQYHEQDVVNDKLAAYATVDDSGSNAPQVDWSALKALNPEAVAWVQIPGTVVNFPVFQSSDNEKYLHTNAEGKYSVGGQVFLDADNTSPGMVDMQSIVYGHHLRNGAMFKPIYDMKNQEMFDSVSTIWYVTETAAYELQPLLIYHTDADDQNVRQFNFASADDLHAYLTDLLGKAAASASDATDLIAGTSNVLTLCTCNYDDGDSGRTLLVCVPKPDAVDASDPAA